MKRNFMSVVKFLEDNFPELKGNISGDLYPVPPIAEFLKNILSLVQMGALAWMVMGGDKLLRMIGFRGDLPGFYWTIQENPVPVAVFVFLLAPQLIQLTESKGAFEIYLDNDEIFSMLKTGSMPSATDLVSVLSARGLKYTGES